MMGCNPFFLGFSDYTNKNSIKVCFTVHIFVLTEKNGTRQMIVSVTERIFERVFLFERLFSMTRNTGSTINASVHSFFGR